MTGRQDSRPAGRRGILSWCLFDWGSSAFNTVIGTFVFSVYFARGIHGDEVAGSARWAFALSVAGFIVAVSGPVLGAIADRAGRRKPWLGAFVVICAAATALLWFSAPDRTWVAYTLVLVVVASIAFDLANVFYNAMLHDVAPPGYLGRVSGWGWSLGYAGGLACLVLALAGFVQPEAPWFGIGRDAAANIRATAPLAALWLALFCLPLFLFTPDAPATGVAARAAVREGLATLLRTLRQARSHGQIVRFLVASALYRDGLATLFAVGGLFAAGVYGMSFEEILVFGIGLNVTAGLGAAGFAFVDDRVGSKPTIMIALAGLVVFGTLVLVTGAELFLPLALCLGLFVGPAQAAGRTLMSRLAPDGLETEMFGLYALAGKSTVFMGTLAFGLATEAFGSQRAGMATILVFLAAGGALLAGVREPGRGAPGGAGGAA